MRGDGGGTTQHVCREAGMVGRGYLTNTPSSEQRTLKVTLFTCPDKEVFSGGYQEAEMSRGSDPVGSESEGEAGANASGLLGPFHVHPVCKSTVLKPCIFTAAN